MEKPKIPFPTIKGTKPVEEVKIPTPTQEYEEQQKEIEAEQEQLFKENYRYVCDHKMSWRVFAKTGLKVCDICKRAYMEQIKDGWVEASTEYPEEWEK